MSRSYAVLLLILAWSFTSAFSSAQDGIPDSSKTDTEKNFLPKKAEFDKFITGQETPRDKKDRDLIDHGAKYYAYRLQWTANKDDPATLAKAIADFDQNVLNPLVGPNAIKTNQEARNLVGKAMAVRLKEVLDLDFVAFRPSVMHAALMLPSLARLKQNDVDKLLADLVADKDKHDAIKLYAFKGMKEFFPAYQITDNDDLTVKKLQERKKSELARIAALTKYIETPRGTPSHPGELDAIRFVRREAIHALAHAEVPALADLKKKGQVEGAVAPTLMRVLIKKGIEPEASLSEKVEAAIGVCNLKCDPMATYQPEMGVYLVGRFLDEYIRAYAGDYSNLVKGAKPPPIAWRIQSERLRIALDNMEKNNQGGAYKAQAERIARSGKDYLTLISGHKLLENPNAFRAIAETVRPKYNVLFKGVKDAPQIDVPEEK